MLARCDGRCIRTANGGHTTVMNLTRLAPQPTDNVQIPTAFRELLLPAGEDPAVEDAPPSQPQFDFSSGFLGVRETASRLGVHENTVRQWEGRGDLKAVRLPVSGFRRFSVADVNRMRAEMFSQMAAAEPEKPRERATRPQRRRIVHGDDV